MGKKSNFSKSEKVAARIFTIIEWCLIAAIIGGFFINWKWSVVAFIFLLWSEYWYAHGAEKWVIDEYEQGGYSAEGLKTMFKSWGAFAVIAVVMLAFVI